MKCKKCKNNTFKITIIQDCSDCVHNAAYDDDRERIYDQAEIDRLGLERIAVEEDGECNLGTAFGGGCYMFICVKCGLKAYLPVVDQ